MSLPVDAIPRADVVVIDEFGFIPLNPVGTNHFARLVSAATVGLDGDSYRLRAANGQVRNKS